LEVSVDHAFTKAISANLGVKYQRFKGEKTNGDDMTDTFSGLTAGVAYTF
jgi:opacity protein-like surface antigen